MKTNLALFLLGVSVAASLRAQAPAAIQYAPGSLDQLVAPIALYPDPLVALILPAATAPTDVVLAARYLEQNGDPTQVDAQPWDPSVKALTHFPELITWMDANLAWTQALGQAYALQPEAVMQAVQAMRSRALAAGSLQSTPQQQVVVLTGGIIEIIPAQPSVIYVPTYDWSMVYQAAAPWAYPLVRFGVAFPIGPWLSFSCDWRDHRILRRAWSRDWDDRRFARPAVVRNVSPPPVERRYPEARRFDSPKGPDREVARRVDERSRIFSPRPSAVTPPNRGTFSNAPVVSAQRPVERREPARIITPPRVVNAGPSVRYGRNETPRNAAPRAERVEPSRDQRNRAER